MAKSKKNHKTGRIGERSVANLFEKANFSCEEIDVDYGEDLFVYGEDNSIVEAFKVFVQVKSTNSEEEFTSDKTIYDISNQTLKNWTISNDMAIVVRYFEPDDKAYYCIPETEYNYWEIDASLDKNIPIKCDKELTSETINEIMWIARIRHYDRLIRITMPNTFEPEDIDKIPEYELFILELLQRINLVNDDKVNSEDMIKILFMAGYLHSEEPFEDTEDMPARNKAIYAANAIYILGKLKEVTNVDLGLRPLFLESCAVLILKLFLSELNVRSDYLFLYEAIIFHPEYFYR